MEFLYIWQLLDTYIYCTKRIHKKKTDSKYNIKSADLYGKTDSTAANT